MEYLGNWHFWLAVVVVALVTHLIMTYVMPKLTGGGATS